MSRWPTPGRGPQPRQQGYVRGGIVQVVALVTVFVAGYLTASLTAPDEPVPDPALDSGSSVEQVARLQAEQKVDREAYAQVEAQLAELQEQLIEQQEELAFYRGIVGGSGDDGLRIQDLALTRHAGGLRLRFTLLQVEKVQAEVRGEWQLRIDGLRAGRPASIDGADVLAAGDRGTSSFAFRYFEEVNADLLLPEDFTAQRLVIRVLPTTRGVQASVESFPWIVAPAATGREAS